MHKNKIDFDNDTINSNTNNIFIKNRISNGKNSNKDLDRENRLSSVITLHRKGIYSI